MIFDGGESEFMIVDVLRIRRGGENHVGYTSGSPHGYLSCRLAGQSEIELPDRILHLDTEHYLLCPAGTEYLHHYYEEELITVHLDFAKYPPQKVELIYNGMPKVKDYFLQLHSCWSEKQPGYMCKCKAILYHIFYLLSVSDAQKMHSRIQDSMNYLYQNYLDCEFNISAMIACSYMSEAYFRRIFRQLCGCSIVEFVSRLRVEYAKSLIESHCYSIREIAAMSGFNDEKYFSQVFRKITGCVPSRYPYKFMKEENDRLY